MFILRVVQPFVSQIELHRLFESLIASVFTYSCPLLIGLSATNFESVNRIFRRCHRIICNCGLITNKECRYYSDFQKYVTKYSIYFFNACKASSHPLHHLVPHNLPRTGQHFVQHCRTQRRLSSFFPAITVFTNSKFVYNCFIATQ